MSVFALGLNHTTAPVDLRGRFAFAPDALSPALRGFRERLMRALPEAASVPPRLSERQTSSMKTTVSFPAPPPRIGIHRP